MSLYHPRHFLTADGIPKKANLLEYIRGKVPKSLLRVSSLWFTNALIVLMILEVPETSGRFLEKLGADVVAGWLGQLALMGLLINSLTGALPRATVLIPILFYSSYYVAFSEQGIQVKLIADELRRTNPARIVQFDSKTHSLVTDQADVFAATHAIPVVYTKNSSYVENGYVSYRLIAKDTIKEYLSKNSDGVQFLSVDWNDKILSNVRILRVPEHPSGKVIVASAYDDSGEGWGEWNIGFKATSLSVGGKVVGIFKSGYVRRLLNFPFFTIGCKFPSEASGRVCQAEFATERVAIESRPDSINRTLYPDPISIMLGIQSLSKYEIDHFHNPDVGADPLIRAPSGEDAAFGALRDLINGRSPSLSWGTSFLIASNPSRLAPFAVAMTKQFLDLNRIGALDAPGKLEQIRLLIAGIAALGRTEFVTVQDLLSDVVRKDNSIRDKYPLLYIRLADAGPIMYSIYRDRFLAQNATQRDKLLAALAICRIGQADSELIRAINLEWAKFVSGELKENNYQSALFVALLKLGQESTVRDFTRPDTKILNGWYEAVLAGRGKTDIGPNNCMPMEWPEDTYVPSFLAPSLKWLNERWIVAN